MGRLQLVRVIMPKVKLIWKTWSRSMPPMLMKRSPDVAFSILE
jgi:hypothetical protein